MVDKTNPGFVQLTSKSLPRALAKGWDMFTHTRPVSVTYAMIFALIGLFILTGIVKASFAPMIFPLAGGFLLIGPLLLSGFFALSDRIRRGQACTLSAVADGYMKTTTDMMIVAAVSTLLFIIWVTNAGTLYGLIVGRTPITLQLLIAPSDNVLYFLLLSSLIGILLAFIIFAISAFSIPLLYYRRAPLVLAVQLSVAAVFANFRYSMLWALTLAVTIIISIIIFPLFLLSFPVLAFASHALYRELFPE
jgi:uncharacterized membrane protein